MKDLLGLTADYASQFIDSLDDRPVPPQASASAWSRSSAQVNTTSSAVTGFPSENRASGSSAKVT